MFFCKQNTYPNKFDAIPHHTQIKSQFQDFHFRFLYLFSQSISPGAVKTEIFKPELLDLLPNIPFLDPEDVSQAVMYALATRPHVQVKCLLFN